MGSRTSAETLNPLPPDPARHQLSAIPLDQLDDIIILDDGVSLLRWRSGGLEHPHDTPPHPLTPSPTSAHSSMYTDPNFWRDLQERVIGETIPESWCEVSPNVGDGRGQAATA